eukprot:3811215-Rhodomonas_salina.1
MVEEAIRVAGSKVIGSGSKPHQSREQKQLQSDATTLRRCEEEWWTQGKLGERNRARLATVSRWPGLRECETPVSQARESANTRFQ